MKIDNGEFYILESADGMEVCATIGEAVERLRESRSGDAEIQKFGRDGGKWLISPVSWREISMLLLEGEMGDQTKS
jgi:hypothetical protein